MSTRITLSEVLDNFTYGNADTQTAAKQASLGSNGSNPATALAQFPSIAPRPALAASTGSDHAPTADQQHSSASSTAVTTKPQRRTQRKGSSRKRAVDRDQHAMLAPQFSDFDALSKILAQAPLDPVTTTTTTTSAMGQGFSQFNDNLVREILNELSSIPYSFSDPLEPMQASVPPANTDGALGPTTNSFKRRRIDKAPAGQPQNQRHQSAVASTTWHEAIAPAFAASSNSSAAVGIAAAGNKPNTPNLLPSSPPISGADTLPFLGSHLTATPMGAALGVLPPPTAPTIAAATTSATQKSSSRALANPKRRRTSISADVMKRVSSSPLLSSSIGCVGTPLISPHFQNNQAFDTKPTSSVSAWTQQQRPAGPSRVSPSGIDNCALQTSNPSRMRMSKWSIAEDKCLMLCVREVRQHRGAAVTEAHTISEMEWS
ncbi:hypothetical protein EV182_003471, partial [Spiromyces aspiralis]